MPEVAVKEKKESYYIGISVAANFLDVCEETIRRKIAKAKTGKDRNPIPYYQDEPGAPYKFTISELKLWRFTRTKGIK